MKYLILLLNTIPLLLFSHDSLTIQKPSTVDSIKKTRLWCRSKYNPENSLIIENGDRIRVYQNDWNKIYGAFRALDSQSFELTKRNGDKDTILVSDIRKIKYASIGHQVAGGLINAAGYVGLGIGTALLFTPIENDPYGFKFLGGFALLIVSTPIKLIGGHIARGKTFRKNRYQFIIR